MAVIYAIKNGNWSDGSTWNTGSVPTAADDVYTNGYVVQLNYGIYAKTITNKSYSDLSISDGGYINLTQSVVITSNIVAGNEKVIYAPLAVNAIVYIVGDVYAGTALNPAIQTTGSNNGFNVNGNLHCEGLSGYIYQCYYGPFTLNGNFYGGNSSLAAISAGNNYFNGITLNGNIIIDNGDFLNNYNNNGNIELNGQVICNGNGKFSRAYCKNSFILNGEMLAKKDSKVSFFTYVGIFEISSNSTIGYSGNNFGMGWQQIKISTNVKFYCVDTTPDIPLEFINRDVRVFPEETNVVEGVRFGTLENQYIGNLKLPTQSVVLKGYEYGDKVGTLEVVNIPDTTLNRLANCATMQEVAQLSITIANKDNE